MACIPRWFIWPVFPGGWIADRFIGQRRATLIGGIVIMCGHIALAVPTLGTFYVGLALLVIGTGFLKPNISTMVGQLYSSDDHRRDSGYSLYYMGINIGAFLAPLVCGWLGQSAGFRETLHRYGLDPGMAWHFGFGAAAVGMAAGLIHYVRGAHHLGDAGQPPPPQSDGVARNQLLKGLASLAALAGLIAGLVALGFIELSATGLGDAFGVILLVITVAFLPGCSPWPNGLMTNGGVCFSFSCCLSGRRSSGHFMNKAGQR